MNTKSIGDYGERLARRYLWLHGYFIKHKNYKANHGEIDIIARKGKNIVFVEVKTRTDKRLDRYGRPAGAVNYDKRCHIRYAISEYMRKSKVELKPRIDIIEVYLDPDNKRKYRIEHIQSAFGARG